MRHRLLLSLIMMLYLSTNANSAIVKSSISFYSERLDLSYDRGMIIQDNKKKIVCTREKCLSAFYETMKAGPHQVLLNDLLRYRRELELNDWLYCKMVRAAVDKIYADEKETHKAMVWWFLLNESGYDVRITVSELIYVFLYAPSDQKLMDMASYTEDGKKYYNLTAKLYSVDTRLAVFNKPKYIANPNGKNFSFSLEKMPNLKPNSVEHKIKFQYQGEEKEITVRVDKVVQEILADYPQMDEMAMLHTGLSSVLDKSLRPQLAALMEGKSQKEQLEVLAAFTRTAFEYKSDWDIYEQERPMYAEQLFQNKYSDQEDRCALYFYLVKIMLDLPMVVISHYNNNMTLGVAINEPMKREFEYKGRKFTICDPTHPTSTGEIGKYPNGLSSKTATVLGDYGLDNPKTTSLVPEIGKN
jgi:hypothetical protein